MAGKAVAFPSPGGDAAHGRLIGGATLDGFEREHHRQP